MDKTGRFTVEADLVEVKDGKAFLKKADGRVIAVPLVCPNCRCPILACRFRDTSQGAMISCCSGWPTPMVRVLGRSGLPRPRPNRAGSEVQSTEGRPLEKNTGRGVKPKRLDLEKAKGNYGSVNSWRSARMIAYCRSLDRHQQESCGEHRRT